MTYNSVYLSTDCWISRRYTARSIMCKGSYSVSQTSPAQTAVLNQKNFNNSWIEFKILL